MAESSISRFKIHHFILVDTPRKAAIVTFCFKIIYGLYLLQTYHTSLIINLFNISDKPMRVLPHLYILLSPGIMDILVTFNVSTHKISLKTTLTFKHTTLYNFTKLSAFIYKYHISCVNTCWCYNIYLHVYVAFIIPSECF